MANKKDEIPVNPNESLAGLKSEGLKSLSEPVGPSGSERQGMPQPIVPIAEGQDPIEALLQQMVSTQAVLADRVAAGSADDRIERLIASLAQGINRLADVTLHSAQAQALATQSQIESQNKVRRPSNEVVPKISVFNRRGESLKLPNGDFYVKPTLKCTMWWPYTLEDNLMTREEVELCNLLQQGEYMLKRIDNSKIKVTLKAEFNIEGDKMTKLVAIHETAFSNDNFGLMPAFDQQLRQLLRQHKGDIPAHAAAVLTDEEEEAMILAGELAVSV